MRGRAVARVMVGCVVAVLCCGLAIGCGANTSSGSKLVTREQQEANERREAAEQKKEEVSETAKNRELLSQIEAKTHEEQVETNIQRSEKALASVRKKLKAAED